MKSADLLAEIEDQGWRHDRTRGSHKVFKHTSLKATSLKATVLKATVLKAAVVIPHPKKDLPAGTVAGIRKSAKGIS